MAMGATWVENKDCGQAEEHFFGLLKIQTVNKVTQEELKACYCEYQALRFHTLILGSGCILDIYG
jgi:hypothetical protein